MSRPSSRRADGHYDNHTDSGIQDPYMDTSSSGGTAPVTYYHPNRWSRYRSLIREPFAEFLGTAILVIFGNGVNCQVTLSGDPAVSASQQGNYLSINIGWGIGTALGVWLSGGISGGHINPAITIAMATFRGFPWRKVPIYLLAQLLGGIVGAAVVYGNYWRAIDLFEGGPGVRTLATAGLFATYPMDYMSNAAAWFDEFLGTVMLTFAVLSFGDKNNMPPPLGLLPISLFLTVLGVGTSLGMQSAYAINPARDLGPRLLTLMVGYGGQVFNIRHQYWIWCPIIAPIVGALFATFVYDVFLYTGADSVINKSYTPSSPSISHERLEVENKI